ncbi:DUF3179 domain-containing protein [Ilyomonas limi]|uniref:DUF3179 domain-containing protein n=1 Tax=Ilyomonas limi TaxID=2575867 RepID=A0A4U3KUB7_9BACT|nr:DUF3179 domain-containing (seleno)protein [Ilyomonas limi]TKK65970.1 DUF3179 domain-containing protein [Ilyomonas limi]
MRVFFLVAGLLLLFGTEVWGVYSLMPFTDIQEKETTAITYFFHHNILWLRVLALVLIAYPVYYIVRYKKIWQKLLLLPVFAGYVIVFYYFNYYMAPAQIYQPVQVKTFAPKNRNKISSDKLVIGVAMNGIAKAYPIQIVGYHHQVADTIGGTPVLITYCTLCRSARVYNAVVEGKPANFVLMGLNNFNSVFEDKATKSWWQQETGVAIAGPMKDKKLEEIPSRQVTLSSWFKEYPEAVIMQPDSNYLAAYGLANNDRAYFRLKYMQANAEEYKSKSLVIGVLYNGYAKAYDWEALTATRFLEDSLPDVSVLLTLETDNASFHLWNRKVKGYVLHFERIGNTGNIRDVNTQSTWNMQGACIDGALQGTQLEELQSYLETWKSWNAFHPRTEMYKDKEAETSFIRL